MRQGPNPKRGRGRGNPRKSPNHRSQTFDSNGPSVRVRGNAYQVQEKYLALARDAAASGDRVAAENYYQHAEHYLRIINAANAQAEARREQQQQPHGNGEDHSDQPEQHDRPDQPRRARGNGGDGEDQPAEQPEARSGDGDDDKPARGRRGNGRGRARKVEAADDDADDAPLDAAGEDDGDPLQA